MFSPALNRDEKAAVARLFSSHVIRELATVGRSRLFARLVHNTGLFTGPQLKGRVRDAFEAAFAVLRSVDHRNEYIYRTALTHRILLGTHNLNTACMLTEFRVGDCKADAAILNGTGTVYEIKSERDTLSRLEKQLDAYQRVFARVFVIAGENHVDAIVRSTPKEIGVLCLSKGKHISTVREADERPDRICPVTVFESIRTDEAKLIVKKFGLAVPDVPNTVMRTELRKMFTILKPVEIHDAMVRTLKATRNLLPLAELIANVPPSLTSAALSIPLRKSDQKQLVHSLDTKLIEAINWV